MAPSLYRNRQSLLFFLGTSLSTLTSATPIPLHDDLSVLRLASRTINLLSRQETTPTTVVVETIYPTPTPSPAPSPSPTGSSDKLYWTSTPEHPFSIPMLIGLTIAICLFGWACRVISKRWHRGDDAYTPSQQQMDHCWSKHGQGNVLHWEKRDYKWRVIKREYRPEEDAMGLQEGEWIGGSYGTTKEMNGLWQQYGERPYVYEGNDSSGGGG